MNHQLHYWLQGQKHKIRILLSRNVTSNRLWVRPANVTALRILKQWFQATMIGPYESGYKSDCILHGPNDYIKLSGVFPRVQENGGGKPERWLFCLSYDRAAHDG